MFYLSQDFEIGADIKDTFTVEWFNTITYQIDVKSHLLRQVSRYSSLVIIIGNDCAIIIS